MRWGIVVVGLCCACGAKSALEVDEHDASLDARRDATVRDARPIDARLVDARLVDGPSVDGRPLPDTMGDVAFDGEPPRPPRPCRSRARPVDLFLVVDSSGSMRAELEALSAEVPTLLRDMIQPPDLDLNGEADWPAIEDLHFAVALSGNGGRFNGVGDPERPGCAPSYPIWQSYRRGGDLEGFLLGASCVFPEAVGGSEALFSTALRALLPPDATFPFRQTPEIAVAHAGYLRDESVLVMLFVTDEDDDSICTDLPTDVCEQRCVRVGMMTFCTVPTGSVASWSEGITELGDRRDLVLGALAGMPVDVSDPDEVLEITLGAHPFAEMCSVDGRAGLPAPRVVEMVNRFDGVLHSICSTRYQGLVRTIASRVGRLACDDP